MTTSTTVLANARKWLGTVENPPKSNRTPIGVKFGWNGVAWCAETVWVVLTDSGFKIPKNASAQGLCDQLVKMGWKVVPVSQAAPGDVVGYDWPTEPGKINHVGIVEARRSNSTLIAIEGNTAVSPSNDGVARKIRSFSCVSRVVRPPYGSSTSAPKVSVTTSTKPTLKKGSTGNAVKRVQRILDHGLKVDGVFGSKTRAAVLAFQRRHGLVADGIVGVRTWKAFGI